MTAEDLQRRAQQSRRHWQRCEYEMARVVDPAVLQRSGAEHIIFGQDAQAPYVERWQWDAAVGAPKPTSAQQA